VRASCFYSLTSRDSWSPSPHARGFFLRAITVTWFAPGERCPPKRSSERCLLEASYPPTVRGSCFRSTRCTISLGVHTDSGQSRHSALDRRRRAPLPCVRRPDLPVRDAPLLLGRPIGVSSPRAERRDGGYRCAPGRNERGAGSERGDASTCDRAGAERANERSGRGHTFGCQLLRRTSPNGQCGSARRPADVLGGSGDLRRDSPPSRRSGKLDPSARRTQRTRGACRLPLIPSE